MQHDARQLQLLLDGAQFRGAQRRTFAQLHAQRSQQPIEQIHRRDSVQAQEHVDNPGTSQPAHSDPPRRLINPRCASEIERVARRADHLVEFVLDELCLRAQQVGDVFRRLQLDREFTRRVRADVQTHVALALKVQKLGADVSRRQREAEDDDDVAQTRHENEHRRASSRVRTQPSRSVATRLQQAAPRDSS